jgi:hypothetical protein
MCKWIIQFYPENNSFIAHCNEKGISTNFYSTKEEVYFTLGTLHNVYFKDIEENDNKYIQPIKIKCVDCNKYKKFYTFFGNHCQSCGETTIVAYYDPEQLKTYVKCPKLK